MSNPKPKILLRPWQDTDADALFALAGDSVIGQAAGFPPHRDVEDSRRVIRDILSKPGTFAIVSADERTIVGCVSALPVHPSGDAAGDSDREIGYWIGHPHWGCGYATAAVTELCDRCFREEALRCRRVIGRVRDANMRSRRVLEKNGFILSGITDGLCKYVLHSNDGLL